MTSKIDTEIRNVARGGKSYREMRHKIVNLLSRYSDNNVSDLPTFLSDSLFKLDQRKTWLALSLEEKDFRFLEAIKFSSKQGLDRKFLRLTLSYVRSNALRVSRVFGMLRAISAQIMHYELDRLQSELKRFDSIDAQSLAFFKLYIAANSNDTDVISKWFNGRPHANWVINKFLYPMIFKIVGVVPSTAIDRTLNQLLSSDNVATSERDLMRFLLLSEDDQRHSLRFKCYVALTAHPADAAELLIQHYETYFARRLAFDADDAKAVRLLHEITGDERCAALLVLSGDETDFSSTDGEGGRDVVSYLDDTFFELEGRPPASHTSPILKSLANMRWSRYPTRADFETMQAVAERYDFIAAGRIVDLMMTSLYMTERRIVVIELRNLIRHYAFTKRLDAFLLMSPRGSFAVSAGLFKRCTDANDECTNADREAEFRGQSDRTWIKRFHWSIKDIESKGALNEIFARVRKEIPLHVNILYLSGIDWTAINSVLRVRRIKPFAGNYDAIYVLLMKSLEERVTESNDIRFALEPVVADTATVNELVEIFIDEYGKDALAFVRVILTPAYLMKCGYEVFYASAFAERLNALEYTTERLGFNSETFSADQLKAEQDELTGLIMKMRVDARQFGTAWQIIKDSALDNAVDAFETYKIINKEYNLLSLLSDHKREVPVLFANGESTSYSLRNRDWPLVSIISPIIDVYLVHPSQGIESILAIRIRHDNFRYEFCRMFYDLKSVQISYIAKPLANELLPRYEADIGENVSHWVSTFMHTGRSKNAEALFRFVPEQDQMERLLLDVGNAAEPPEVIDAVLAWLQSRLDAHLMKARSQLERLKRDLDVSIRRLSTILVEEGYATDSVTALSEAVISRANMRADEMMVWFEPPHEGHSAILSCRDVSLAVRARFRQNIESKVLRIRARGHKGWEYTIPESHVRLAFDAWCELIKNALKHGTNSKTVVTITALDNDVSDERGFLFSSLRTVTVGDESNWTEVGEAQGPAPVTVLGSGKTGLSKVAYLAAAISGKRVEIRAWCRPGAFHVFVPFSGSQKE